MADLRAAAVPSAAKPHPLPPKPPFTTGEQGPKRQPKAPKPPPPDLPTYSWRTTGALGAPLRTFRYITNIHYANHSIAQLKGRVVGFDAEWKPNFVKGGEDNPISLVQLADESAVLLIHISAMNWQVPQALKMILEDESTLKVGVGIQGDADKILRDLGIVLAGCVDLSQLALSMDRGRWQEHGGKNISLAKLTEVYVHRILEKRKKIQRGNWERLLSTEMQEYAANDAASGLSIYLALEHLRMTLLGPPSSGVVIAEAKQPRDGGQAFAKAKAKLEYRETMPSIDSGVDSSSESTAVLTSVTSVSTNTTVHERDSPRASSVGKTQPRELLSKDEQPLAIVTGALTLLDRFEKAGSPSPGTGGNRARRLKRAKTLENGHVPNVSPLSLSTPAAQGRSRRPNKRTKA